MAIGGITGNATLSPPCTEARRERLNYSVSVRTGGYLFGCGYAALYHDLRVS